MVIDTSALVAIVFQEPEAERLTSALLNSPTSAIGSPTLAELSIVLSARMRRDARTVLLALLHQFDIHEIPFGRDHWNQTADAYLRFGKGRHPAQLNFGDCMAYATAKLADAPLLFVGDGFGQTDISVALR